MSSRVSGSRVDAERRPPPPDLAERVETLWLGRWDLPADAPHTTRMLGDPCAHLCVERSGDEAPRGRLVGVWTQLWERTLAGRGWVAGVKLHAGAAGVVGGDASRFRNRITPLGEALPGVALPAELGEDAAFELLVGALRSLPRRPDTELAVRACRLARAPEIQRVDQLADALGLGVRDLQRVFRVEVGAPPKHVIRRHRLQEAAGRIERGEYVDLAELAQTLGYADQAHLTRDFKAAVGATPSAFRVAVHR